MSADSSASVPPDPTPKKRAYAFYSVSDSRFFLGAVALLNSLRLAGHDEPIFIVDTGLTPEQRTMLADHVTLIPSPSGGVSVLLAPLGPSTHPAEVAILLDADIIVVRPLTELIDAARTGRIVTFVNNEPVHDRFFSEWSSTLDLPPLPRRPYVNAGQLFVPESLGRRLLPLWTEAQEKVALESTRYGSGRFSDPFYFADQDVLNAILAGHFEPEEILTLEHRLAPHPPFTGLRLVDEGRLVCRYADGSQPFLLHHTLAKPWLKATRTTIYSLLLPRLLLGPDVALRLEPRQLPLRLREGRLAAADRRRANIQALIRSHSRRQLGRFGIRTRIADRAGRARQVTPERSLNRVGQPPVRGRIRRSCPRTSRSDPVGLHSWGRRWASCRATS